MRRSVAYRLVAFLTALFVSLSAPGLALTHGLAHAHLAQEHAETGSVGDGEESSVVDHDAHAEHAEHGGAGPTTSGLHAGEAGDDHAAALAPREHEHRHGHATVAVAPGTRDLTRLTQSATLSVAPEPPVVPTAHVIVRSAALSDRALLARPAPVSEPPPRLRAPPVH